MRPVLLLRLIDASLARPWRLKLGSGGKIKGCIVARDNTRNHRIGAQETTQGRKENASLIRMAGVTRAFYRRATTLG